MDITIFFLNPVQFCFQDAIYLFIVMKYIDILFKDRHARSLAAGDINDYKDQNESFHILLVCRLKSKNQLRIRNTHEIGMSWIPANPEAS